MVQIEWYLYLRSQFSKEAIAFPILSLRTRKVLSANYSQRDQLFWTEDPIPVVQEFVDG